MGCDTVSSRGMFDFSLSATTMLADMVVRKRVCFDDRLVLGYCPWPVYMKGEFILGSSSRFNLYGYWATVLPEGAKSTYSISNVKVESKSSHRLQLNDLGIDADLLLTFDDQPTAEMYKKYYPSAFAVRKFGAEGG
ncbi:uncharacterized protein BJ212DRAFT_629519 [Suillus subaureus]|uniref:Uncharacterized protein n=1 Tax=Suillus subaureus TaxID=48587 RepID=A0A9P7E1Z9_9AGAM|nr:uncharacterized protein BJ212DRAFT_629519 [Suillus subaureus]KAG1808908.1 hypothetical protein BJ212DRAFT_629519 [Suillus subaureus]